MGFLLQRHKQWVRSVNFGGIQWGTNFATQPKFITFPLPTVGGEAVMPSVVDVYINNALAGKRNIPSGPFQIDNIPVVTGNGNINLVVTDELGREKLVSVPFYASTDILRPGLHDFSYDIGFVRNDFGIKSFDYGRFVAVGTDSYGFNNNFTGQWHGEVVEDHQTFGLGGNVLLNTFGIFTAAFAGSHNNDDGSLGGLLFLAFDHQNQIYDFGFTSEMRTSDFVQLGGGRDRDELPPKMINQAFVSFPLGGGSALGFTYIGRQNRDADDVNLFSANYNRHLNKALFLSISGLTNINGERNQSLIVTLTTHFGNQVTGSASGTADNDATNLNLQLQKSLPEGTGYGYNLRGAVGDDPFIQGGLSYQNDYGTYSFEVAKQEDENNYQVEGKGGLAYMGGEAYLSRTIDESFAVARVPDYPNVRVYLDNQVAGRTNAKGNVLIPGLSPYEKNPIRLSSKDIPLSATVKSLQLDAIPFFRSGVILTFPVIHEQNALLTIKSPSGKPIPLGATVVVIGQHKSFPVGQKGEVYLTGLSEKDIIEASWKDHTCRFTIKYPVTDDPLPNLGTYNCKGVTH